MIHVIPRAWLWIVLGLIVAAGATLPSGAAAGTAPTPSSGTRATVVPDVVTVLVSVVVDEDRAGSADFTDINGTADGIAASLPAGRPAGVGEQAVVVIDQTGTEIDRGRTDRDGRVVLDGPVDVPFVVALGGVNIFSDSLILAEEDPMQLSIVTYVPSERASEPTSRSADFASPSTDAASSGVLGATDHGDPGPPQGSGSTIPGGLWAGLALLGILLALVSLATHLTARLHAARG